MSHKVKYLPENLCWVERELLISIINLAYNFIGDAILDMMVQYCHIYRPETTVASSFLLILETF